MINQLRKKFIFSAMLSVFLTLMCIISSIYALTWYQMEKRTDALLEFVITLPDGFSERTDPSFRPENNEMSDDLGGPQGTPEMFPSGSDIHDNSSPIWDYNPFNKVRIDAETPFRTRYYIVHFDNDGNCTGVFLDKIASVSESVAISYGTKVYAGSGVMGRIGIYKYLKTSSSNGTDCTFLDISEDLDNLKRVMYSSLIVATISFLALFFLIWIISGRVIRPFEQNMELQKRFITDAGHELKTPLAIISANTEVVEMTAGKSEWTSNIHSQISRMTELIQRLLVLARMEEGNLKNHFSDFSLTEAVIQSAEPFITLAQTQGKTMSVDVPEKLSFHGDERSIRELISILCDNAVKYCDDNGSISLSIQNMGKKNRISVVNTFVNADKSDSEKWFGRFYRDDLSRSRDTGGFGIGLSIAKAITDAHKGKIRASFVGGTVIVDVDI